MVILPKNIGEIPVIYILNMLLRVLNVLKKPLRFLREKIRARIRAKVYGIGIVDNYLCSDILKRKMENIHWITPNHKRDYYADPFITDYFGEPIVFFEYWINKECRGNISYAYIRNIQTSKKQICNPPVYTALKLSSHLSYPYLFEYNGDLYMVPENYQSHTISLYKANGAPDRWEKVSTCIDNFDGIDSNIYEFNGRWWLFSTLKKGPSPSENSTLYIWYSDSPLGNWTPHKQNPIVFTEPIARGAGRPFMVDGNLYRPAQDCTRTYGGALLIKEITTLTPDEYEEMTIRKYLGYPPFADSYHTFNSCGVISVIDGTRIKYTLEKEKKF